MDDDAVRRLGSTLSPATTAPNTARSEPSKDDLDDIRAALRAAASTESFGRSLTQALAIYLNRPVRVSAGTRAAGTRLQDVVRYVAESGSARWWIEFEARLVWSFADAMFGGPGVAERPKDERRIVDPVGRVASVFLAQLAAVASTPPPGEITVELDGAYVDELLVGTCAVGADPYGWRAGIALVALAESTAAAVIGNATTSPRRLAWAEAEAPVERLSARERVTGALGAACSSLQGALRCALTCAQPDVREIDDVKSPPASLRLALTAGGSGALVLSATRDAVAAFASGAAGVPAPSSLEPGPIELAAAEAPLRQLIRDIVDRLPRLRGVPQRIVHLASGAQLARTPCIAATIALRVAGSAATLNLIVPEWMTESA